MFVSAVPRLIGGAHHHQTATGARHRPMTGLTVAGLLPMSPRQGAPPLMNLAPGDLALHCCADCLLQNFLQAHFPIPKGRCKPGQAVLLPEVWNCMGLIVHFIVDIPGVMAFQRREVAILAGLVLLACQLASPGLIGQ